MNKILRFSSIIDFFSKNDLVFSYDMEVPYTDTYSVEFKNLESVAILDDNNKEIINSKESFKIDLIKGQKIVVVVNRASSTNINIKVSAIHNKAILPYEPYNQVNTRKLRTHGNNNIDPLTPAEISSVKRDDGNGLYINCNNPEKLTKDDIGKALSRVDISNKKVFFTFEHNNLDEPFYYGYQVKNTGDEDIYVTVLNMGFQLDGQGCWLGEREWVDFYNANFRYDGSAWSDKQKETFIAYFNFANNYKAPRYQPVTYRIPKNKYIYIMGGTTKDAYKHINVFKTANKKVNGGCSNGVVLFDVIGKAEGSFFVYTDEKQILNNTTHQGYIVTRNGHDYGSQYVGYDTCHGVVDTNITFTFNDLTPSQDLPVKFYNYHDDDLKAKIGKPYLKLNSTPHLVEKNYWVTHINPQETYDGVGTDMTKYYTINDKKEDICIDADHLDGHGNVSNIGNWMMDYMDYFTFVNQGDKDRTININMKNTGSLCVLIRDKNGKLIKSSPMFTIMLKPTDKTEEYYLDNDFNYSVVIKAHSIKQFIIEYNLLANSCGHVTHKVTLK